MSVMSSVRGISAGASASSASVFFGCSGRSVPVRTIHGPAQHAGNKEEDAVDDSEGPCGLEHGTWLIEMIAQAASTRVVMVANLNANGDSQVSTVGIGDSA